MVTPAPAHSTICAAIGLKPGAVVDARLEHQVALLARIDARMREHAEVERLVRALGDDDLRARRAVHVEDRRAAEERA